MKVEKHICFHYSYDTPKYLLYYYIDRSSLTSIEAGQYMAFGLSANPERSVMIGGDVVVAWVDKQTLQGYAIDYFLDAKSQCSGGRGSCPDTKIQVKYKEKYI